jgi:hypothetical protein
LQNIQKARGDAFNKFLSPIGNRKVSGTTGQMA